MVFVGENETGGGKYNLGETKKLVGVWIWTGGFAVLATGSSTVLDTIKTSSSSAT